MAIVAADWTVTRSTGVIDYTGADHNGAATYATVIQFHRWLQDLADDAEFVGSSNDELDIVDNTPSDRSTDNIVTLLNGFSITATAAEHLYDGSVIFNGGAEVYDGIVNFGNADVQIQIIQNGAVLTDDYWNEAGAGLNADATAGISHRFMLLVRTAGADIDGRRLIGTTRTFNNTYAEFKINGTSNGNNVLALVDSDDLNNDTAAATVATWTTIVNETEGFVALDVDNNTTTEDYYSEWNRDTFTINQFYERMKWLTRDGSASTNYGLNGEVFRGITHELDVDGGSLNVSLSFGKCRFVISKSCHINAPNNPISSSDNIPTNSRFSELQWNNRVVIREREITQNTDTIDIAILSISLPHPLPISRVNHLRVFTRNFQSPPSTSHPVMAIEKITRCSSWIARENGFSTSSGHSTFTDLEDNIIHTRGFVCNE